MNKLLLVLCTLMLNNVFAGVNDCDDYLQRHYKKDLVVKKLSFSNRTIMGDIQFPHQVLKLTIRNQGQEDFTLNATSYNWRSMKIKVNGVKRRVQFRLPLYSASETTVYATLPPRTLTNCKSSTVQIDLEHTAGQWGCQVWNNDSKTMKAFEERKFCRAIPGTIRIPRRIDGPRIPKGENF
jgi:hypothetical protein